jgi:hypothetical protein
MSTVPTPTQTPNVVISNPNVRAVVYGILAWANLATFIAVAVFAFVLGGIALVPVWLLAVQFGLGLASAGVGFTAQANTPSVSKLR